MDSTFILGKRASKPKTQYSPSDPLIGTTYHLTKSSDTGNWNIVGNSSVKRFLDDGNALLNNGTTSKIYFSGTKERCLERWKRELQDSDENSIDECEENEDDEYSDHMIQTLQRPQNTFSTPAPRRRKNKKKIRSFSPDLHESGNSAQRLSTSTVIDHSKNRSTTDFCAMESTNLLSNQQQMASGMTGQSSTNSDVNPSLNDIFKEMQNARKDVTEVRSGNENLLSKLNKLAFKMNELKHFLSARSDQNIDQYRDSNQAEIFKDTIMFGEKDLLTISARNPGEYARSVLKVLFTKQELQEGLLPSPQVKRYAKPELDQERFLLLNDAVRTRYRIAKHRYDLFYKEKIQTTLAACVYNEGIRKQKRTNQSTEPTDPSTKEQTVFNQNGSSITINLA